MESSIGISGCTGCSGASWAGTSCSTCLPHLMFRWHPHTLPADCCYACSCQVGHASHRIYNARGKKSRQPKQLATMASEGERLPSISYGHSPMTWPDPTAGEQTLLPAPLSLRRSAREKKNSVMCPFWLMGVLAKQVSQRRFLILFRKATNWTADGSTRPSESNSSGVNSALRPCYPCQSYQASCDLR